jgi:hypothetical protein
MKKLFLFFTLLLIYASSCLAQYINTSHKDAREIKKRILLVVLPEDDKDLLKEYEEANPTYATLYKNDMEGQRMALKEVVLKHWKYTDSLVVVSQKEVNAMVKKYPDKYAVMKTGEQMQDRGYIRQNQANPPQVAWEKINEKIVYNSSKRHNIRILGITSLVIELPKRVMEVYLPKMSSSEGDYIYAVTQMEYILSTLLKSQEYSANKLYRDLDNASGKLKNKILLLDGSELGCKEAEIKKVYPYPFKIVSYEIVEKALKTKDSNSVVIQSSRYDINNSTYYLSNAGNGAIYCNYTGLTFNYGQRNGMYNVHVPYPSINVTNFERYGSVK